VVIFYVSTLSRKDTRTPYCLSIFTFSDTFADRDLSRAIPYVYPQTRNYTEVFGAVLRSVRAIVIIFSFYVLRLAIIVDHFDRSCEIEETKLLSKTKVQSN